MMDFVNLKDVSVINMGQSPKSSTYNESEDGLPFFQGNADFGEIYPVPRVWCNNPVKTANYGDILISVRAPIGAINYAKEKCCIGRGVAALTVNENLFLKDFIYWCLKSKSKELQNMGTGSTFKAINKKTLEEIQIPKVDIYKQKKIVELLNITNSIRKHLNKELELLDEIVKARFVEMFGNPIYNTQNRQITKFENVVKMQRGFDLPVQNRKNTGVIPVYGANGILDYHEIAKVHSGGIITGRSGTIGKVFYTYDDFWPLNTTLFSIDTHGNNLVYLKYLLELYDLKRFVEGTGVPTLNRNMFHNKKIIDISLEEQNQFADFVRETDKSRLV